MDPNATASLAKGTFYAQARQLFDNGVPMERAIRVLTESGMDSGRARELAKSLYGAPKVVAMQAAKSVSDGGRSLARSAGAGLAAAIAAAIVWGVIAAVTGCAFGFIAIGAGAAVGLAVRAATPEEHQEGFHLPLIAAGLAMLSVVMGHYFGAAFYFAHRQGMTPLVAFTPMAIGFFLDNMARFVRPFDLIWFALSISAAFKIVYQEN
ncbi:MAG TPA: hypothetical protein VGM37_21645 [Armatimonadota bacterium]|jgi:hypothetical protein